jgi:hypothetical protein
MPGFDWHYFFWHKGLDAEDANQNKFRAEI